jgi:hypothetical protein
LPHSAGTLAAGQTSRRSLRPARAMPRCPQVCPMAAESAGVAAAGTASRRQARPGAPAEVARAARHTRAPWEGEVVAAQAAELPGLRKPHSSGRP